MMFNKYYILAVLITVLFAGCRSASVVRQEPPVVEEAFSPDSQDELRGIYVSINSDGSPDPAILEKNLKLVLKKASNANFNMIFIPYRSYTESMNSSGYELENNFSNPHLEALIDDSHQLGLKSCFTINLNDLLGQNSLDSFKAYLVQNEVSTEILSTLMLDPKLNDSPSISSDILFSNQIFPYLKSFMKGEVRKIIEVYDIDGISYDLTYWTPSGDSSDTQTENKESQDLRVATKETNFLEIRFLDILEDIVVETMMVKPYLLHSITYPGNDNHEFMLSIMEHRIVDFITPAFDLNDDSLVDEMSGLWNLMDDYDPKTHESIFPGFRSVNQEDGRAVLDDLIAFNKEMGSHGSCILVNILPDIIMDNFIFPYKFPDSVFIPEDLKKRSPFDVAGLKLNHLFITQDKDPGVLELSNTRTKIMDSNNNIGLVLADPDSINFEIEGRNTLLTTNYWSVPYRYTIYPDSGAVREGAWVEFRKMPSNFTNDPIYHFLCKTEYPATARIDGETLKVYKTGIFFKEIEFKEGSNRIRAEVLTSDSLTAFYEMEFIYKKDDKIRPVFPLWIEPGSVRPSMDLELLSEDNVTISFQGSRGQRGYIELYPGGEMVKCSRKDFEGHSQYMAEIHLNEMDIDREYQFILNLETDVDTIENKIYKVPMENTITVRNLDDYPVVKIKDENTRLTYNLGPIRLGGPIRSELDPGVMMKVSGRMGDHYRIRLNEIESSIVRQDQVDVLPLETLPPSYFITNISCGPGSDEDIVSIPYLEPVPYTIFPEPDQNRIVITLYGVKTSSTWISHRRGRNIVDKVTWQQTTPETYQVFVNMKTARIWGYDLQPDGRQLVLRIKSVPQYELNNEKPLTGLKIAIEAGHGGESTGAVGLSGLLEKDINLDLALKLGALCEEMGAEVIQVRKTDETIGLLDKRSKALASNADLLISIHANAAGTSRGYLRVPGTSTYYNNPFWAPLAENVYDRLLELGLAEFGVVGSFNYTVIRVSQMPTILVEQAFMTHAEDEEKLADPEFRERMAGKIYEGIIDYLSFMNDDSD